MLSEQDYIYDLLTEREKAEVDERNEPIYYYNKIHVDDDPIYDSTNRLILKKSYAIDYRYEVISQLGKGAFGNVFLCKDHKREKEVALKVVRNERRFHKQSKIEVDIYEMLLTSGNYSDNIIRILKAFFFRNDVFIVFEVFGINLYQYYQEHNISKEDVKSFSRQIANGLNALHNLNIIHMDLKPENIMVRDKHLKIIDLGSSMVLEDDKDKPLYKSYIQSRYYRSPEVVFKLPITTKIDVWSFGCIVYELLTRRPLFPARCMEDLVIHYVHVLGYPSKDTEGFYDKQCFTTHTQELARFRTKNHRFLYPSRFDWSSVEDEKLKQFIKENCLNWESEKRYSIEQVLEHEYFTS